MEWMKNGQNYGSAWLTEADQEVIWRVLVLETSMCRFAYTNLSE